MNEFLANTTSEGWVCLRCNTFVKWNETHECSASSQVIEPANIQFSISRDNEIIDLLTKILAGLKDIEYNTRKFK